MGRGLHLDRLAAVFGEHGRVVMIHRGHARERGWLSSTWERRRVKRASEGGAADSTVLGDGVTTAHQTERAAQERMVRGGVMRDAVDGVTKADKDQLKHDAAAELLMPSAVVAATRIAPSVAAEHAVRRRLSHYAPETMGYLSPWTARLAGLCLFVGGCILNATTYAGFEPAQEDGVTRLFEQLGISTAWALGAFQMMGFTLLGYGIAYCLVFGLVPRRGMYAPAPRGGDATDAERRMVHGHFSPAVYLVLAGLFLAFAVLFGYAVAKLRAYGSLLDGSLAGSTPGAGSTVGSLGGGAGGAAGTADDPAAQMFVFMVLAMLELVATIAVFVCLEPAIPRTLRALRRNTERELRYVEKRGGIANKRRVRGAVAGLKGRAAILHSRLRGVQADLHAIELEAVHRRHNPKRYPDAFEPALPEVPDELPAGEPMQAHRVKPLPYGTEDWAPLTVDREQGAPGNGEPTVTKEPTIAMLVLAGAGIADAGDYTADGDGKPHSNGSAPERDDGDGSKAEPEGS